MISAKETGCGENSSGNIGRVIRNHRVVIPMTLYELSAKSGVSQSHLSRIERGDRFPSARTLQKIASLLGFDEWELFTIAGYLTVKYPDTAEGEKRSGELDPMVAMALANETIEVQRAILVIISTIKSLSC